MNITKDDVRKRKIMFSFLIGKNTLEVPVERVTWFGTDVLSVPSVSSEYELKWNSDFKRYCIIWGDYVSIGYTLKELRSLQSLEE